MYKYLHFFYCTLQYHNPPAASNSHTLPRSFHSPKHSPPNHHSPYNDDPQTHHSKSRSSPYKEEFRHSPSRHRPGSSNTTASEGKKKKEGKRLVKQWVQEQQLRYVSIREGTTCVPITLLIKTFQRSLCFLHKKEGK